MHPADVYTLIEGTADGMHLSRDICKRKVIETGESQPGLRMSKPFRTNNSAFCRFSRKQRIPHRSRRSGVSHCRPCATTLTLSIKNSRTHNRLEAVLHAMKPALIHPQAPLVTSVPGIVTNGPLFPAPSRFTLEACGPRDTGRVHGMSCVENPTSFVCRATWEDLPETVREQLGIRVLDSTGCAVGALEREPIQLLPRQISELRREGKRMVTGGGSDPPHSVAFYKAALVLYLEFNNVYLAKGEPCDPSENPGAVPAVAEPGGGTGRDLLTVLAAGSQVQRRLNDGAPLREKEFDHVTQGSSSGTAGLCRAAGPDEVKTANGIAIRGTAFNGLGVTRTGRLSHWKGGAFPNTTGCCTRSVSLAMNGITGPLEVFEREKGFTGAIAGVFELDWLREDLERVERTILKRFDPEIHAQAAVEGLPGLKRRRHYEAADVRQIEIETFDVRLRKVLVVAGLGGDVMPAQSELGRIVREDVQHPLRRVSLIGNPAYSQHSRRVAHAARLKTAINGIPLHGKSNEREAILCAITH